MPASGFNAPTQQRPVTRWHRLCLSAGLTLLLATLAGCASSSAATQQQRDRVLTQYRAAAGHMQRAEFSQARPLLDDVILTLGGLSAGDASARRARSYFRGEDAKNFRGEPYERAMAYYYRGILYWMDGEPDNARACFRSAQFQDADAEENSYQGDYALFDYLDGLASRKLGGDGSDALKRARASTRIHAPPEFNPRANVLVFYEMGQGPTKYATGEYNQQLRFRPGSSKNTEVRLRVGPQVISGPVYDDLTYQATTRGGRVIDHVLANKAVFKGATDAFGDAAIISGAILATQGGRNSAADEVGLGLLAAGLISKAISAATVPRADTRTWDNLPNLIGFASLEVPPGQHTITVEFLAAGSQPTLIRTADFQVLPGARDVVLFFSDRYSR
jgi:hypothetical protein